MVDYKLSSAHPLGLAPYELQLGCYALAAERLLGDRPVRTGVAFLREGKREPELMAPFGPDEKAALEAKLVSAAASLWESSWRREWKGLEERECEALGCGYRYRCHQRAGGP